MQEEIHPFFMPTFTKADEFCVLFIFLRFCERAKNKVTFQKRVDQSNQLTKKSRKRTITTLTATTPTLYGPQKMLTEEKDLPINLE